MPSQVRVVILGSTGSIGTQTLAVARSLPDRIRVVGLAAGANETLLRQQGEEFGVRNIALFQPNSSGIPSGMDAIIELATLGEADVIVVSVAGVIGLLPTIRAIEAGKNIALASKEVLVAGGEVVMPLVRKFGVKLTPIDSEHSAIFQCIQGVRPDQIDSLILTASGGPFRGWTAKQLAGVTVEQALNHPTWKMGGKITIDSATLMNKALETIEAHWLFDVPMKKVEAVVHPQSIVHSFVRLTDGSVLAQLGWPNMELPIQYALLHPERDRNQLTKWDPVQSGGLTFERIDEVVFPALSLARRAVEAGGTAPAVFNAANEEAVAQFLQGSIKFLEITAVVEAVLAAQKTQQASLESLLAVDATARQDARKIIRAKSR